MHTCVHAQQLLITLLVGIAPLRYDVIAHLGLQYTIFLTIVITLFYELRQWHVNPLGIVAVL